jgi:NTE family protein
MKVGLVLGAGGVLGGAWLTGSLHALAEETDWDPGSAEFIVGTSAGSMIGVLAAGGVPPWFMVAHSAGESFDGVRAADGTPAAEADRAAGAVFRLHRGLPTLGPGSLRMAFTALRNPLAHTPLQMMAGWLPAGLVSTDSLQEIVRRAVPGRWVVQLRQRQAHRLRPTGRAQRRDRRGGRLVLRDPGLLPPGQGR